MEQDFSNPVLVISIFFGLILTGFVFIVKLVPLIVGGGVLGSLFALFGGGFAWFSIFAENNK